MQTCNFLMGIGFRLIVTLGASLFHLHKMIQDFGTQLHSVLQASFAEKNWQFVLIGLAIYFFYFITVWVLSRISTISSSSSPSSSDETVTISKSLYNFLARAEIKRKHNADEIIKLMMKLSICETRIQLLMIEKQELQNQKSSTSPKPKTESSFLRDRIIKANSAAKAEKSSIFFGSSSSPTADENEDDRTLFAFDDSYVQQNSERLHASGHISFDDLTGSDSGDDAPQMGVVYHIANVLNPLSYFTSPSKGVTDHFSHISEQN